MNNSLLHPKNIYAMECNHQMKNPLIKFGQRVKFFLSFIHDSSSVLQNWVTCHSAVAAKHWNPRQRRKGPFNNYVYMMREEVKNVCFCPRSRYKNCPRRGGGSKIAKFCPRSCWMTPKKEKAIRIFGDFLYCALCIASLWTEMENRRSKLFGIKIKSDFEIF